MTKAFSICTEWDEQAHVWVATSDGVLGLVTEADTLDALFDNLRNLVPELAQANGLTADVAMKPKPANALLRVGLKAVDRAAFSQAVAKATDLRPAAQNKVAE